MSLQLDVSAAGIKEFSPIRKRLDLLPKMDVPPFALHRPDLATIGRTLSGSRRANLVVIGNGGSINSFLALAGCLAAGKSYHAVTTPDPDLLGRVESACPKRETLVMPVSKSGTNTCPIEGMLWFLERGYTILPVTAAGVILGLAEKLGWKWLLHPDIGGRFAGLTACGLAPASALGIPVEDVWKGGRSMHRRCRPDRDIRENPALLLAATLYMLESKGFTGVFLPAYSSRLAAFNPLITQLMHESACKSGKGQTFFCAEGPEVQHHSTQRLFGGRRDMAAVLVRADRFDDEKSSVTVPKGLRDIPLRKGTLQDLGGVRYSDSVRYDFEGVRRNCLSKDVPHVTLSVSRAAPETAGEFMAFWQWTAVYSAVLRGVDPFDQPEVEFAKEVSFELRRRR
jgi:glucose-6-phosphate isomerase